MFWCLWVHNPYIRIVSFWNYSISNISLFFLSSWNEQIDLNVEKIISQLKSGEKFKFQWCKKIEFFIYNENITLNILNWYSQ